MLIKRGFDIIMSIFALLLLWPVMIVIAVMIALRMGRPVLFTQTRPGLNAKPFTMVKYRTMTAGQGDDAARLTGLGRFLRATSLDELPELWNVLRGDMSLVGPRPLLMEYLDHYTPEQARRHMMRPGITGWAQVNGRNESDWEERLAQDVWYIENQSFMLDIKIIFLTLIKVIRRDGVSHQGHATMPRFDQKDG